jgi:hypothetical protein
MPHWGTGLGSNQLRPQADKKGWDLEGRVSHPDDGDNPNQPHEDEEEPLPVSMQIGLHAGLSQRHTTEHANWLAMFRSPHEEACSAQLKASTAATSACESVVLLPGLTDPASSTGARVRASSVISCCNSRDEHVISSHLPPS